MLSTAPSAFRFRAEVEVEEELELLELLEEPLIAVMVEEECHLHRF